VQILITYEKSANSVDDPVRRGQRQVQQVKVKMSMQIDDRMFQSTVIETQVCLLFAVSFTKFDRIAN